MGVLAMNPNSNAIQDMTSGTCVIHLQMQSSLSSPEWIAELAQKTVVMFGTDKHTAVITLNSADKGSLKIVLHIKGDQVSASFYSNDADVLQALQNGKGDLESSMLEAGLVLSQLNISSGSSYRQSEAAVQGDPNSFDSKLDLNDLHSAKMVSFYV
jgi:flagellar hook-length control protein FliK